MQVGQREVTWEEGRLLVFDDMYPHEVWNDSNEVRIVLLLQVRRPERFPGSLLRDGFFAILRRSSLVADAWRNLNDWDVATQSRSSPATGRIL
jgi:beta-hydroxylase